MSLEYKMAPKSYKGGPKIKSKVFAIIDHYSNWSQVSFKIQGSWGSNIKLYIFNLYFNFGFT